MKKLLILFALMIAGLFVTAFATETLAGIGDMSARTQLFLTSAIQSICMFAIPAIFVGRMSDSGNCWHWLELDTDGNRRGWIFGLGIFIVSIPALNLIIEWNAGMHLPEAMSGLEQSLRTMEDAALATSSNMLSGSSAGSLIVSILIVGVLVGFCEELFFRGALMRLLADKCSRHVAIWLAAIIFSTMHFQFFGFVPRVLLGALFGYIYYWSGTLWAPAAAHALNNSLAVIGYWLTARGSSLPLETLGTDEGGSQIVAAVSILLVAALVYAYYHKCPSRICQSK